MTPRSLTKVLKTRLPFVSTLESVFAALAGTYDERSISAEDRLLRRAANDAAQR